MGGHSSSLLVLSLLRFLFFQCSSASAQEEFRTANLSTSWLNTGSLSLGVGPNESWTFLDGSNLRPILLHQQYGCRDYALGFYRYGNHNISNSFFLVLLMFEIDLLRNNTQAVVIWIANRDQAVRNNATLEFDAYGDLILRDVDGTLVWSTNTTGLHATTVLLEESNLMLVNNSFNTSNKVYGDYFSPGVVWQSYNHPTDTWMGSQELHVGELLSYSTSVSNSSTGMFYLSVTDVGLQAFLDSDPPQLYATLLRCPHDSGSLNFPFGFFECYPSYVVLSGLSRIDDFIKLEPDGHLKYYSMSEQGILRQYEVYKGDCSYATVCGNFGICSKGICDCPLGVENSSYFSQVTPGQPQMGCAPVTPLSCQDTHLHTFLELPDVTYFDFIPSLLEVDAESCKRACLNNCSCIAALFRHQRSNISSGNCSLVFQLLSMMTAGEDGYRSFTFLKVQKPPAREPPKSKSSSSFIRILIPTLSAGLLFFCLVAGTWYYYVVMVKKVEDIDKEGETKFVEGLIIFTREELRSATQDFRVKLGQGGFGSVFEGNLQNGTKIAVKQLENPIREEACAEAIAIRRTYHSNLVRLIGYSSNRFLVYEHVSNGSLDKWIFHQNKAQTLIWETRRKIILGIARGLEYLHVECNPNVIHFDIKPQNILLDEEFNVKIADFGLAKLVNRDQSQLLLNRAKGTLGYVAPEMFRRRHISTKVDVYSFGVVILEIICGRKNIVSAEADPLIDLVRIKAEADQLAELVDEALQANTEEAVEMIKIAIWCLQSHSRRPFISMVVSVLEGLTDMEPITNYEFLSMFNIWTVLEATPRESAPPVASILSGPR